MGATAATTAGAVWLLNYLENENEVYNSMVSFLEIDDLPNRSVQVGVLGILRHLRTEFQDRQTHLRTQVLPAARELIDQEPSYNSLSDLTEGYLTPIFDERVLHLGMRQFL